MRYVEDELAWEELRSEATLNVGQLLKFGAEVQSHSTGANVVTDVDGVAMIREIDPDGDVQLAMLESVGVSTLAFASGDYWFLRQSLIGAVRIAVRRTASEPAGASASVPPCSTGGRSPK